MYTHKRNFSQHNTPLPTNNPLKKGGNNVITNSSLEFSRDISNKVTSKQEFNIRTNQSSQKTKSNILKKDFNSSPGVYKL